MLQDGGYHWGGWKATGQRLSIRLLWHFNSKKRPPTEKQDESRSDLLHHTERPACAYLHTWTHSVPLLFFYIFACWAIFCIQTTAKTTFKINVMFLLNLSSLIPSTLSCAALSKRLRRGLSFHRSETHCIDFDIYQPDWGAKRKQKCGCRTLTFSLYPNKHRWPKESQESKRIRQDRKSWSLSIYFPTYKMYQSELLQIFLSKPPQTAHVLLRCPLCNTYEKTGNQHQTQQTRWSCTLFIHPLIVTGLATAYAAFLF